MLYATTRSNVDIFTAQRVLKEDRAPDGALFVPMTLPPFMPYEIRQFTEHAPSDAVALVLNCFFNTDLSGRDVEFAVGRELFATAEMPFRMVVAELWRNPDGKVDRLVRQLAMTAAGEKEPFEPGEWAKIAVRIGLLAALCGEMGRKKLVSAASGMDVAVSMGDEAMLLAAWYARRMGLPIGRIIVSSNGSSGIWELVNRGQLRCVPHVSRTSTPQYDSPCLDALERLIYASVGRVDSNRFVTACRSGATYQMNSEQRRHLSEALYVSVIGSRRVERTIPNVYGSFSYILSPYSALTYCGVMDYRAETGARSPVLLPAGISPANDAQAVTGAMGISEQELRNRLKLN